jgi:predicted  nucleic acid-binding Zn-ribbon protein
MGWGKDLLETVQRLAALEKALDQVVQNQQLINDKIFTLAERVTRIEERQSNLRENVKSQIVGDLKADLMLTQMELDRARRERMLDADPEQ